LFALLAPVITITSSSKSDIVKSDIVLTLRIGLVNSDEPMRVYSYENPLKALADFTSNFYNLLLVDVKYAVYEWLL
jgi:hypothetical protein